MFILLLIVLITFYFSSFVILRGIEVNPKYDVFIPNEKQAKVIRFAREDLVMGDFKGNSYYCSRYSENETSYNVVFTDNCSEFDIDIYGVIELSVNSLCFANHAIKIEKSDARLNL